MLGIGPKTAAALVAGIDIGLFPSHDKLASFCGIALANSQSSTSIRSTRPQRGGNRHLKNLLIFSCNLLVGTDNRFGRHCEACRDRNTRRNMVLKAVARKRLRVIYAIMRDPKPYVEAA
ncbi:transposase [Adlercreutzia muris]|uniref:transposase n=1 Tax=Adlercreutzia muris TaxID=1796610 RepID=UPI001F57E3C5|nr:transposase [Adlercreutzia muris]